MTEISLPFNTTTVSIYRPTNSEPYVAPGANVLVVANVRAVFDIPSGSEQFGQRTELVGMVYCDPVYVPENSFVIDDQTGERWEVQSSFTTNPFPPFDALAHTEMKIHRVTGSVTSG